MACLILRSCTTGNNTIIVTDVVQSPTIANYVGYHVPINGVCYSVELSNLDQCPCVLTQDTEVKIDSIQLNKSNLVSQNLCNCTSPFIAYILTPCDNTLPSLYTQQNLNPYVGQTITFFGQDGVCYTVIGSLIVPIELDPVAVECIAECSCNPADCGCPPGYVLNDNNECVGFTSVDPIINPVLYTAEKVQTVYAPNYGVFYEDITNKQWPISATTNTCLFGSGNCTALTDSYNVPLLVTDTVLNSVWGGSGLPYTDNRINVCGIWTTVAPNPINEWIGFTYCVTVTETTTYFLAFSVDNATKIYLDGELMIDTVGTTFTFKTWQLVPVTLNVGSHIFDARALNIGGLAVFGFEIYKASLTDLLAVNTPGDLAPYIVFTTADKIDDYWETGQFSGYTCPDGYSLNTCDGLVCSQIATVPQLPCDAWEVKICGTSELDPIITNTDLTVYEGGTYKICITSEDNLPWPEGCYCVTVTKTQVQQGIEFNLIPTNEYACCEDCTKVCYLLEDCQGAVDPIITCTDLSQYVDNVVKLSHCGNICWKVTLAEDCTNSILVGEVIANYPAPYVTGQICTYAIPSLDKPPVSYYITINGTIYEFPYSTNAQVLIDLNSLNLGEFSAASNTLVVVGENEYGTLCYKYLTGVPICIAAVCSTYQNNCQYIDIPQTLSSRTVFITINGQVYTTVLTNFNINKLVQWLNSLNLGIFTINCVASICSINVYGNEVYGNIVVGVVPEDNIYTPTCTGVIDFTAACEACLPPAPTPAPLVLHPRRIKPGYFTKNSCITTEYMERVNCNFAKQVYDAMLIKRYGITVCCDHDVDTWDIKKQVLDFELLTDPSLCKSTLCYCLAPCFVSASITVTPICLAPALVDATIDNLCYAPELVGTGITVETEPLPCNCYTLLGLDYTIAWIDCCCIYQSATFVSNATVCAHYPPVVLDGTVTITAAEGCGSDLCVVPPPICYCWLITPDKVGIAEVNYTTCDDIPVIIYPVGEPIAVCSPTEPNIVGSGVSGITGFCNTDCGILSGAPCRCYTIDVQSTNELPSSVTIQGIDCNDNFFTETINSTDPLYYTCSKIAPKVISGTPNAQVLINILYDTACVNCAAPVPCVNCYEIITTVTSTIYWTDCNDGPQSITSDSGIFRKCSLTVPTSTDPAATITLAPFDCDSPLCVDACYFGAPPICYTVEVTSPTAQVNFFSCANVASGVSVYYTNVLAGDIITGCATNNIPYDPIQVSIGTATITPNGPCTLDCVNTTAPCICYRVSVYPGMVGTITFGYIDCNDIFQTATVSNTDLLPMPVCSKSAITFISFTSGAGVLVADRSTDDCSLGQCI